MDTSTINADKVVDTSGLSCPMPLLKTKKAMKELSSGQVLQVIGTDPGSKNDIPEFGNKDGNEFLGMQDTDEGKTNYYIKKG
ncbi:SirA family protein [Desulfonatronospira thiodismutans ASO3-1]|uniref:SirA family protein n=1 Tax=Desulfonatronospira thiodismutans ASO3-1 TaxID=555779 RepID=D6ST27_9BACT|nr:MULTISPECIES: sulfurtransferase TusA family protein [Desulfonatronospira]EFI33843.1 SirA family protein [Desulfonatronospira thiodismutans ASO3-1]RQD78616.1 MAG: sulfurtransferase TusA family protein [Desulfonatronospira sp. MSAO_Bac3]